MKIDMKKMDLENLNELIGLCEDKMVSPFKKKKPEPDAVEVEEEETDGADGEKPDLSEMDMEDLLELYNDMK